MAKGWFNWLKRGTGTTATAGRSRGFMARLRDDRRGNVLAIMAATLLPMIGMVGGGIDLSRMYIVKTRLQHACDAGALAGRKAMGGGTWSQSSYLPRTRAEQFFVSNFQSNAYGSTGTTKTFTENAGTVVGNAQATVPMTLMRVFGKTTETIAVTCQAEMRLPNTDVMFVLDTTGSMNCVAGDTSCTNNGGVPAAGSKIDGLKDAVKCFYEIVAQQDTDANCSTGTPSGGLNSQTQVRFGFMPYASNVNVGYLLPTNFFADTWNYQSRVQNGTDWDDWGDGYYQAKSGGVCTKPANTSIKQYQVTTTGYNGGYACYVESRDKVPAWIYKQVSTTVSGLKNGTGWNTSLTMPLNNDGSNKSIPWSGCIEERQTVQATNYNPIPSGANDLNIDMTPSGSGTLWGFSLPDLIYLRDVKTSYSQLDASTSPSTTDNYYNNLDDNCPTQARRLQVWSGASAFDTYVDSMVARGNTYHDIGMLWGARFMSPTGIFASDNATTPQGGEIQRHMIFMTDGDSTANPCDYNAYGVPWFDKRQTNDVGAAADCGKNRQALIDQINLRLEALCIAVKNKNITLWVVSYGGGVNATTETRLQNCASSNKYFQANDSATLQTTFKSIANQISQLRLTK